MTTNRRVVLRARPDGMPTPDIFGIEEVEITDVPTDHILVRVDSLSIDAFIRTTLDEGSFHATAGFGDPVTALGVGEVVASEFDGLQPGDWVSGPMMRTAS